MNNTFITVKCPKITSEEVCDAELPMGIAVSHHSLVSVACPKCGTIWRLFHGANSEIAEFTEIAVLADEDREAIPLVHYSTR